MDSLATFLERSGSFKVLRRLDVQTTPLPERLPPGHRLALFLDTETTGLELNTDEIIEFAAVPFSYDRDGTILAVHEPLDQLRDPGRPIPGEVTRLTGIDDAMVQGKTIDMKAIERLLSVTHLVIAHNAQFDRAFAERLCPLFASLPWACSMTDVPWREEDVTTLKLEFLAMRANLFFDAHRAQNDCLAAVEILRRPLPLTGRIAMAELLRNARRTGVRIAAVKAPFDRKELLKSRGDRWRSTPDSGVMAWTVEVGADRRDDEIKFLREEVYGACVELPITRVDAYCRYSARI